MDIFTRRNQRGTPRLDWIVAGSNACGAGNHGACVATHDIRVGHRRGPGPDTYNEGGERLIVVCCV